jgi:hypothetical protein
VSERRFLPYEAGRFLASLFEGQVFAPLLPGPFSLCDSLGPSQVIGKIPYSKMANISDALSLVDPYSP